jgi:hypothetical protein
MAIEIKIKPAKDKMAVKISQNGPVGSISPNPAPEIVYPV